MKLLRTSKKITIVLASLLLIVFIQAIVIAKLFTNNHTNEYEVNLVKINTQKDSIDYVKIKKDLGLIDQTIRKLHSFFVSKNIPDENFVMLSQDSLSNSIYLAKQTNRYSQYLVDLQNKLQNIPLGMPTDGYISSNFGNRKNPIPIKTTETKKDIEKTPASQVIEEKDSLGNVVRKSIISGNVGIAKTNPKNSVSKVINNLPAEADQIQFHKGLDIAVAYGSDVSCAASGTVIWAGVKGGYGNCVIVSHGNGLDTLYAHLSQILVKTKDKVKVGQIIAKSGNTGRSTGPHLHYEVHKNGTPINPKLFMTF